MLDNFNRVLILGPHTDDGEIGAGATISRFCREGKEVYYVAFSICEESVPEHLPKGILAGEILKAGPKLGLDKSLIKTYRYKVRRFNESRQEILEDLIKLKKDLNPDLVFLPCSFDIHQDHKVIHDEGVRAFKKTNILGYELPWNNLGIENRCFIEVQEQDYQNKINAIKEYKSQSFRNYINDEYIKYPERGN
jgi:LmbE family N-acetylglucosaminyl deacetylase